MASTSASVPAPEPATAEATASAQEGGAKRARKSGRSFKVVDKANNTSHGRYNGSSPYQAANKAFSEIIRTRLRESKDVGDEITFSLQESTIDSSKKVYTYVGQRIKLDTPVVYKVAGGQEIVKEYKNILHKVKDTTKAAASSKKKSYKNPSSE